MKRLSIIVPMYKVEPYIEMCIRSLEDQDILKDDYEIICINDGSPDDSKEIVKRFQKEFINIILIDQENQGVSCARNNGIDRACGDYLLFVDPDDYVDKNSFSRILQEADRMVAQVSFLGFTVINENGTVRKHVLNELHQGKCYPGTEAYFIARNDWETDPDRMWAILFRRKFINSNDLRFLPEVPFLEDGEFITRILCLSDSCIFDGRVFYNRTTRPGSATNSKLFHTAKATNGFLLAANNLRCFQQRADLDNRQREFLNQPIVKFVLLAVNSSAKELKKLRSTVDHLHSLGLSKIEPKGLNRYFILNGRAYNISPYLSVLTLFLYSKIRKLNTLFSRG